MKKKSIDLFPTVMIAFYLLSGFGMYKFFGFRNPIIDLGYAIMIFFIGIMIYVQVLYFKEREQK